MSRQPDKSLEAAMGRRRPKAVIQEQAAESIIGEMVPGGISDVPVECLYRSRFQVRTMGSDDDIDRLAASIQTSGMISPIIVRPLRHPDPDLQCKFSEGSGEEQGSKKYEIVTGHHRVLACVRLGWDSIPVVIKAMTDAEAAIALTADNAVKKDLTDWDRYLHIKMLEDTGACKTGRGIAAALGISPSQVTNLRAFERLPQGALKIVRANPGLVGYRIVYSLTNYRPKDVDEAIDLCAVAPAIVTSALALLGTGVIKDQQAVAPWVATQMKPKAPRTFRREVRIQQPHGISIKISVTDTEAVIKAPGLNMEKLQLLLEANLESLITSGGQ